MARYLSLHALGCLPKQAFAALCRNLFTPAARTRRVIAGQIAEKLLVEFDADDAQAASSWLHEHRLAPLWIMRIDYESVDGDVREL